MMAAIIRWGPHLPYEGATLWGKRGGPLYGIENLYGLVEWDLPDGHYQ